MFRHSLWTRGCGKGFTLIEVLMVIAMLGILTAMSAPFLANITARNDVSLFAVEAADALREAQSAVMSGKNNDRYGVHFEEGLFTLFQGATYSAGASTNVEHTLPGTVTITGVALTPGGSCTVSTGTGNCDVHFASIRGNPTESGTVTFSDGGGATRTVTISAVGVIEWN